MVLVNLWNIIKLILCLIGIGYAFFLQYQILQAINAEYHLDDVDEKNKSDIDQQLQKAKSIPMFPSFGIMIVIAILLFILPR